MERPPALVIRSTLISELTVQTTGPPRKVPISTLLPNKHFKVLQYEQDLKFFLAVTLSGNAFRNMTLVLLLMPIIGNTLSTLQVVLNFFLLMICNKVPNIN